MPDKRKHPRCRLYLLTPTIIAAEGALAPFTEELKRALDAGDVACVQLRLKDVSDDVILRAGERLMPIVQAAGAAFLINDRPDLAARLGADGAHIGQEDMSYEEARTLLGADKILGVTAHNSRHLAMEAAEKGADYVAFGAFFPTTTKEAKTRADIDLLHWWSELFKVPCVAIGGITPENAAPLVAAGADFLAAASSVWNHPNGAAAAVRAFNALFDSIKN
ncbi:MAG TPA: thiamine phosphate synthase [Alphaproteobacteria bacterium]|nr:thiamine phosphate synthase [Alphaproteobacteria bacterium]